MSLSVLVFTCIPPIVDLVTDTHVFHPQWPEHARMHTVWLLGTTTSIGMVSLYHLWCRNPNINLAGLLGLCVYGAFFLAAITTPLYGGALTDAQGGVQGTVLGIDLNVFVFSLMTCVLLAGWFLSSSEST